MREMLIVGYGHLLYFDDFYDLIDNSEKIHCEAVQ